MSFSLFNRTCKECGKNYSYSFRNEFMTHRYCSKRCITQVELKKKKKEAEKMAERVAKGSIFNFFSKKPQENSESEKKPHKISREEEDLQKFNDLLNIVTNKQKELQTLGQTIISYQLASINAAKRAEAKGK
ncbi:MAG: hypothetical protein KDK36_13490, partial [Leptospiraceae bacterium]|nr:hypothetical protein [Leptospiraceae bacterium]